MSDIAIRVEGLGKKYRIGALQLNSRGGYKSLRDSIAHAASLPFRAARNLLGQSQNGKHPTSESFWALKDISFEVKRGDIVGVIGRNGAGKSTLLKVLSRITEPTTGRAEIHGRIGSLLEVGTGFHPELTGRENVFLNGAILGMRQAEIARQFDEIVAFADVEKFIDTPVKHYSSGMYLRLAFAVAAHLETEVLLVDEVLAVGDFEFQAKCLKMMKDVSTNQGRTVIFVSHNMAAIRALCSTGLLMEKGAMTLYDHIQSVSAAYISLGAKPVNEEPTVIFPKAPDKCDVWIESASVLCNGTPGVHLEFGDRLGFKVNFKSRAPIQKPLLGYLISSSRGENAVNANNYFLSSPEYQDGVTEGTIVCDLGEIPLMAGSYMVTFWLCRNPNQQHHVEDILHFTVEEKDIWGNGKLPTRSLSSLWWPTEYLLLDREVVYDLDLRGRG